MGSLLPDCQRECEVNAQNHQAFTKYERAERVDVLANALVHQIFDGKTSLQINRICETAHIERMTVNSWIRQARMPRVDLLAKVAAAAGFELTLQPRQEPKAKPMGKYTLVTKDGRIDIMINRSKMVGYVEDDTLTALDASGYAVQIGAINHRAEIIGKLDAWRTTNHM